MSDNSLTNSKKIAKNTAMLYFRMLLLMVISLYTSRINLEALGVIDFGIYGVVGGVVAMFWIVSTALVSSINRFLTFEIGTGNQERLNKIFATAISFQYLIAIIVIILAETIGLWFLNYKLVIPTNRLTASNWVYQLSVLSFCLDLLVIPYTAVIIAHEKMSAFAYIGIITAFGKLLVAWTSLITPFDHLIWFGCMITVNSTIVRAIYIIYCKRNFEECKIKHQFDKEIWKEMFGFAGWSFIGTIAAVLRDYGGNILINIFSGPAMNAARGIALQVNGAVSGFVDNFQTAVKPQITKSYASGDHDYMMNLIYQGSRLSFYILYILVLPILCNTFYILHIWLGNVPQHSVLFVRLILLLTLNETLSGPLITAMLATGHIRNFQIIVGGMNLLNLPISYIVLKLGAIPESVVIVAIIISVCCTFARILLLRQLIKLSFLTFMRKVYFNVITVALVAGIVPICLTFFMKEGISRFVIVSLISLLCSAMAILYVGCNGNERKAIYEKFKAIISRFKRIQPSLE